MEIFSGLLKAFAIIILAGLAAIFTVATYVLFAAAAGWSVAYLFADTYDLFATRFGWPFEAWETGALLGFVAGFLNGFFRK